MKTKFESVFGCPICQDYGFSEPCSEDSNWDDVIAVSASKRLMEIGYSNVYSLRGGLEAWVADGNAVDKGAPSEATEDQAGRR